MDLEKNKQRLEILATEVEELKNSGGGGTVDAYTKTEADNKFAEKTNVYTKTEADTKFATNEELEGYVSKTDADNDYIKNAAPVVIGTTDFTGTPSNKNSVFLGNITSSGGSSSQVLIGQAGASQISVRGNYLVGIGSSIYFQGGDRQVAIGQEITSSGSNNIRIGDTMGGYRSITGHNNICIGSGIQASDASSRDLNNFTILGSYPNLSGMTPTRFPNGAFIVSNGTEYNNNKSNLFSYANGLFYRGNDTVGYDLCYFAPADETLTNGGTISATALANALKHVPLSFNAHMCYYSYEDNDNVYYTSTRLNGTSLHTNIIAINKTTGVATFNEFDQS